MKRIRKILLTAGLALGLLLVPVQGKQGLGAAGIPTIDISNLLENVLSHILQESDHALNAAEWAQKLADVKQYIQYAQNVLNMYQMGRDIVNCAQQVVESVNDMVLSSQYFLERQCPLSVVNASLELKDGLTELYEDLLKDATDKIVQYSGVGMGNAIQAMRAIDDFAQQFRDKVYEVSSRYRGALAEVYRYQKQLEIAFNNDVFLRGIFF